MILLLDLLWYFVKIEFKVCSNYRLKLYIHNGKQLVMKIGEIASQTNCNIETIRYYEKINLLPVPIRSGNGYRNYSEDHIKRLRFIRRCRELGFSIEEIRALIRLVDSHDYTCNDVRMIAMEHIADIRRKIADLKNLEKTLSQISAQCSGDSTPECAILEALFDNKK